MKPFILFLIFILPFGCVNNQPDKINVQITDFSIEKEFVLKPIQNKSYVSAYFKIKGFSNDTIKIDAIRKLELIGNFDTILRSDYYGDYNIKIKFSPYKANKGNVKISGTL